MVLYMENYRIYRYRWIVLAVYMYITALTQLFWLNFAAIDTFIEKTLNISAMKVGFLALVFPIVYLFLSIPAGIVIDRKGFRFSVGIGALFTGVFAAFRLINPYSYTILLISQIGIAVGQPFVLNSVTKLVSVWFPKHEEATAVGLGSLALFIGMLVGLALTPQLVSFKGFITMNLIYFVSAFSGIFIFFIFGKARPLLPPEKEEPTEEVSYGEGIKNLFRIRNFVLLGFIAFIGIGVFNGLATWLEKILTEMHGISMIKAGNIAGVLIFSGMIGCVIIPLISDIVMRRKPFLFLGASAAIISLSVLLITGSYTINLINAVLIGFFLISLLPILLTFSTEVSGPKYAGISVAYLQLLGNGAAVAIVPVMELLHKTSSHYLLPILLLIILLITALLLIFFLEEKKRLRV